MGSEDQPWVIPLSDALPSKQVLHRDRLRPERPTSRVLVRQRAGRRLQPGAQNFTRFDVRRVTLNRMQEPSGSLQISPLGRGNQVQQE